jgi:hypothetical protein
LRTHDLRDFNFLHFTSFFTQFIKVTLTDDKRDFNFLQKILPEELCRTEVRRNSLLWVGNSEKKKFAIKNLNTFAQSSTKDDLLLKTKNIESLISHILKQFCLLPMICRVKVALNKEHFLTTVTFLTALFAHYHFLTRKFTRKKLF